ncbi:MAG TPA: VOC family protein [Candidatus Nitrosotalea sp.]|nr:VOC family protein [Candidatus Nitrosotalea sp.]
MFKRVDHIGVIVDDLAEARGFLVDVGLELDREFHDPGRLDAAFYRCGDTMIEVIEINDVKEREERLGGDRARIEHLAVEVADMEQTLAALAALGVRTKTPEARKIGATLNIWTEPQSSDGVVYQLVQKL